MPDHIDYPNGAAFLVFFCFPTSPQKKHNGSLYDLYGICDVFVEDFAPLLKRPVFTGLIDLSCFILVLSTFFINYMSATFMLHYILYFSPPEPREIQPLLHILPKTTKSGNSS